MTTPKISAADRLRMQTRTGRVASIGAPATGAEDPESGFPAVNVRSEAPLAPGEFPPFASHLAQPAVLQAANTELPTEPLPEAIPAKLSAADRLRNQVQVQSNTKVFRKEMAAMRTLTRLLFFKSK